MRQAYFLSIFITILWSIISPMTRAALFPNVSDLNFRELHNATSSADGTIAWLRQHAPQTKEKANTSRGQKRQNPCPTSLRAFDMFVRVQQLISVHDNKLRSVTLLAFSGLYYGKKRLELKWLSCD